MRHRAIATRTCACVAIGVAVLVPGDGALSYGGPLAEPEWRGGPSLRIGLKPPKPGGRVVAGMAVVRNRGEKPAVIERVVPVRPGPGLRVAAVYSAGMPRDFMSGDDYGWPPPRGDFGAGTIRPAAGRVVPPVGAPGHRLGIQLLLVIDLPRRGRYTFHGVRVDYRVRDRRYWVTIPIVYAICTPRSVRCPLPD